MPLKLKITLDSNVFEAEGDFSFDAGLQDALRTWFNAQQKETTEQLEELAAKLEGQNKGLETAVAANQPKP